MGIFNGIELKQLVCNGQFNPRWESYELNTLGPKEVRVQSQLTAAKHGTEHSELLGKAIYIESPYLGDKKIFDRSTVNKPDTSQWKGVGNTTVGLVIETGAEVEEIKVGDQVWGYGGFRSVHQGGHFRLMADGFTPEAACCMDPANFALAAVRDGNVRVGEKVIIFGMGAIGLFTVQLARLSGATDIIAVDPIENRRELALKHGATLAVDPDQVDDFALASRDWLGDGADVTIEASGSYHALNQAIRATRYAGNVVPLAFYSGKSNGLHLGEEFHFNQLNIISARACSHPQRDLYWSESRIFDILIQLFSRGDLMPHGLPSPVVSSEELPSAYGQIFHNPREVIKVAVCW